jgi:CBS domain containing-hemolysin-like protein
MNDDRSRNERVARLPADTDDARERWYERLLHRFGLKSRDSIRDDLEDALSDTLENADFSPQERAMLKNVLGFHRIRVDDVMVPRADIVAVAADTSLGDLLNLFRTAGHSRLPVYGETLDDPKGMVHIRDFLDFLAMRADARASRRRRIGEDGASPPAGALPGEAEAGALADGAARQGGDGYSRFDRSGSRVSLGRVDLSMTLAQAKILRPVLFVPPSMPAVDLLVRMQATRTHMALVIDEYGGTDGLVSIEDLVEMVVGNIEDEHDDDIAAMIVPDADDTFLADARASLDDVTEIIGIDLHGEDSAEDIDTLGGFIVTLAGRVPSRGELVPGPEGLEFEILDADPRRVKRLRIHRREVAPRGTIPGSDAPEPVVPPQTPARVPPENAAAG